MFKFLKDKLKGALNKFTKEVEEEARTEVIEETKEETKTQKQARPKAEKKPTKEEKPPNEEKQEETVAEEPVATIDETITTETKKPDSTTTEAPEDNEERPTPEDERPQEKTTFFGKLFKKKEHAAKEEETIEKETTEPQIREQAPQAQEEQKKEGFFTKITKITLSEDRFNDIFWELEVTLLENNVAVEVIEKIKDDLRHALTGEKVARRSVEQLITDTLRKTITEILTAEPIDLLKRAADKKPLIIAMIGVNGSGKTTTLAKLITYFKDHGKTVVVAAADTFRAAAIQQLEEHTTTLGVKLIKHDYNADPAAVAYDAVKHATAKGIDIVLIDTAGRLHSNDNLMSELKKLIRINKPDINLFVGEAITGNDCVEQAQLFDEAVGIDGIILAKADVDEKGGAAISASFITKKPILFLGTGQNYKDLTPFKPGVVLESLGL